MAPTLQNFTRSLLTPDLSFATLTDARPATGPNGLPALVRTTCFAEARITWRNEDWFLSLPLSPAALHRLERTAATLRRLNTPWLTEYRILPGEMRWTNASGETCATDLVLQRIPAGCDFTKALACEPTDKLLAALDALQAGLRELGFTHNNLKAANLRWSAGRFIPLRYHDAAIGTGDDSAAFDTLRREIAETSGAQQTVSDTTAPYAATTPLAGHRWTSHVFEGLICVEDEGGYGFVDTSNSPVIAAQYLWAGDFREGRAEVETPTGMGLIDRAGNYIIPPDYEIVDYDPAASIVRVRFDGRWALFDYLGRRLTEFGTKNE